MIEADRERERQWWSYNESSDHKANITWKEGDESEITGFAVPACINSTSN